jgi:hypothetical protein
MMDDDNDDAGCGCSESLQMLLSDEEYFPYCSIQPGGWIGSALPVETVPFGIAGTNPARRRRSRSS